MERNSDGAESETGAAARAVVEEPEIGPIPPDAGTDFRPDGRFYRIERGWILVSRLSNVLGALLISGGLVVPLAVALASPLPSVYRFGSLVVWLILAMFLLARAWIWPARAYRRYLYRLDDTRLQIRRGVLWREVLDIPRTRIQHTDVGQGPIERSFELAHLVVHTAGTTSASVRLDGLRQEIAFRIREELLRTGTDDAV